MAGSHIPRTPLAPVRVALFDPTSASPSTNGLAAFCISAWPNEPRRILSDAILDTTPICNTCRTTCLEILNDFVFVTLAPPPLWAGLTSSPKTDSTTPSLHLHYANFIATTSCSAPVPRIGTLTLVRPPLVFLPWHRDDRFPRSVQKPKSSSCHLYAGRRPDSKQVASGLILEFH
jgi:hypothetical protein